MLAHLSPLARSSVTHVPPPRPPRRFGGLRITPLRRLHPVRLFEKRLHRPGGGDSETEGLGGPDFLSGLPSLPFILVWSHLIDIFLESPKVAAF